MTGRATSNRVARTVRVYAEFGVRALSSIAKHHWHRHRSTTKPS